MTRIQADILLTMLRSQLDIEYAEFNVWEDALKDESDYNPNKRIYYYNKLKCEKRRDEIRRQIKVLEAIDWDAVVPPLFPK